MAWTVALVLAACKGEGEASPPIPSTAATVADDGAQHAAIRVTDKGFEPSLVKLKQGGRGVLDFTRETDSDCLNAVSMPWAKDAVDLPKGQTVAVEIPDMTRAGEFTYACWMNMVFGRVVIEPR
jgi:plastocyanin domain-containing protein